AFRRDADTDFGNVAEGDGAGHGLGRLAHQAAGRPALQPVRTSLLSSPTTTWSARRHWSTAARSTAAGWRRSVARLPGSPTVMPRSAERWRGRLPPLKSLASQSGTVSFFLTNLENARVLNTDVCRRILTAGDLTPNHGLADGRSSGAA